MVRTVGLAGVLVAACASSSAPIAAQSPPGSANSPGADFERGSPPSASVQRIVRGAFAKFEACYEGGRAGAQRPGGTLLVGFTVDPSGRITDVSLSQKSTLRDPQLGACVLGVLRGLTFPDVVDETTTFFYPLAFSDSR